MQTQDFILREISSFPVCILIGIRIICTPFINCVYLSLTGIFKPHNMGTRCWVEMGYPSLVLWLLWELLQNVLSKLSLTSASASASTLRFLIPCRVKFIFLVFKNPFSKSLNIYICNIHICIYTKAIAMSSDFSIYSLYLFSNVSFYVDLKEMNVVCRAVSEFLQPDPKKD